MLHQKGEGRAAALIVLLATAALACNLQFGTPGEAPGAASSTAPPGILASPAGTGVVVPSETSAVSAAPAEMSTATSTVGPPPTVLVSASGGRLNVRRGPGPEYDTVGAFLDGQSTTVTGRNSDGSWVLINVPNTSRSLGWITVKTKYTTVTGDVAGLPPIVVSPAVPAYIRNCTPHEMLVNPGGLIVLERSNDPENKLQFFPGEYTVIDQTTEADVGGVTVFEGKTVDIKKDSSGKSYTCP